MGTWSRIGSPGRGERGRPGTRLAEPQGLFRPYRGWLISPSSHGAPWASMRRPVVSNEILRVPMPAFQAGRCWQSHSLPFPLIRNPPCIGDGSRQGRAKRADREAWTGGADAVLSRRGEWQAGAGVGCSSTTTAFQLLCRSSAPYCRASIRTFFQPIARLVPAGVRNYRTTGAAIYSATLLPQGHRWVRPWHAVTRTRRN